MKRGLGALALAIGLALGGRAIAQAPGPSQCVASAYAGGTGDAITIPALPCGLTTNLLILTVTAPNGTTTPTLQPLGSPALPILRAAGIAVAPNDLVAGGRALLNSTGTSWILLNPATTLLTIIDQSLLNTFWNPNAQQDRLADRVFLAAAVQNCGSDLGTCGGDWMSDDPNLSTDMEWSQVASLADPNASVAKTATPQIAFLTAIESPNAVNGATPRALEALAFNNPLAATHPSMWGFYSEAHLFVNAGETFGWENEVENQASAPVAYWDPYNYPSTADGSGPIIGAEIGCGAGQAPSYNCNVGMYFMANPQQFTTGIDFFTGSIAAVGPDSTSLAIALPTNYSIIWFAGSGDAEGGFYLDGSNNLVVESGNLLTVLTGAGTASKYVCADSSNHWFAQSGAC